MSTVKPIPVNLPFPADQVPTSESVVPIKTAFIYPPIPDRRFDWQATRGDPDEGSLVGWGRTEQEAIADLLMLEEEGF